MPYFIDFITSTYTDRPASDWDRRASLQGQRLARAFALERREAGESYRLVITSEALRSKDTADFIFPNIDAPRRVVIPELFDPKTPDTYSKRRRAAFTSLESSPLRKYQANSFIAMDELGSAARSALQTWLFDQGSGRNILVVGHMVYINQIILSTFFHELTAKMKDSLLTDAALTPCEGYRLQFDNDGKILCMTDLPQPDNLPD